MLWSTPLLLTSFSPSGCFLFPSPHPHSRRNRTGAEIRAPGPPWGCSAPTGSPGPAEVEPAHREGAAVTMDWVG